MRESKYNIIQPILLSVVLAIGMVLGYKLNYGNKIPLIKSYKKEQTITNNIEDVFRYIDANYLYKVDIENLKKRALNSVIAELDMYSNYISPNNLGYVNERIRGNFMGVGINSFLKNDTLFILGVFDGSPAQKAGLREMDKILQIGNKTIGKELKNINDIKSVFSKNKGEDIDLLVLDRNNKKKSTTVHSDIIQRKSIDNYFLLPDSSLYVVIDQFTRNTYREFMTILEKYAQNDTIQSLVIDLRDNPGGLLQEVNKILDQFFSKPKLLLVKTVFKDGRKEEIKTTGKNFYQINNIKVLINSNSASGSEILAGVLQDYDRGIIIGTNSFGKGLVQEQYSLRDGGALRLTTANYYLPTGRSIQKPIDVDSQFVDVKINHYDKIDTFYSFDNSRVLLSGKGIHPDVVIDNIEFDDVDYLFSKNNSSFIEWAIEYIVAHRDILQMSEQEFIYNYKVKIDKKLKNKIENFEQYNSNTINTFLKAEIAYILFGSNAKAKMKMEVDPYLKKAMEMN